MKKLIYPAMLIASCLPLQAQTVLEWALSETVTAPDTDDTASLGGTLDLPIIGDGVTAGDTNTTALVGRFEPIALENADDSITISYDVIFAGGITGNGSSADFRWGLFNSNGDVFGGAEENFENWSGALAWNSGDTITDADIRLRNLNTTNRFYVSADTTDLTGDSDFANQDFSANGVTYTISMTVTRLADDSMQVETSVNGDDGYEYLVAANSMNETEFTFDRVGFWINAFDAERVALQESGAPSSGDGDGIPDLQEIFWFGDLSTADDTSDFDSDGTNDLQEITVLMTDPTAPEQTTLLVDFNADGTSSQIGPNLEPDFSAFTASHENLSIQDPAGMNYDLAANSVNIRVSYESDNGNAINAPTVMQMIGRNSQVTSSYEGTQSELIRDWIGVDSRLSEGGNGSTGDNFGSTNMKFTISGLAAGSYLYRGYHHDAGTIQGSFELAVADANRSQESLGDFQMTSSGGDLSNNEIFDANGTLGIQGVLADTLTYDVSAAPLFDDGIALYAAVVSSDTEVTDGQLSVFIDDFPASSTGSSNERTWYQGIGYRSTTSGDIFYVDATLANTDNAAGTDDTTWADGDDGTTGGTSTDGTALNDGLWRYRSTRGENGVWEATGSSAQAEDCVKIVTTTAVPNDTYEVYVFFQPVGGSGPIRASLSNEPSQANGTNPGIGNPPSVLSSTLTIPFQSNGTDPVEFIYRVFETPGDENLSVVGVNGFEIITQPVDATLAITSISKDGNQVTLSWVSQPNATYDIVAGTDLLTFDNTVANAFTSQAVSSGDLTTAVITLGGGLASEGKVFFRVEQR